LLTLPERSMSALSKATPQERRQFWLFLLIALVILGAGIGLRDPWPSDEPRFTLAAKQMVESGDWMFPHRGSELYADKPPMLMWAEAASFELVRWWRLAFMLPSLLAGLGTLLLVYDLRRRRPAAGVPVRLPEPARADRSLGGVLHHRGELGPAAPPAGTARLRRQGELAAVLVRLLLRGAGRDHQGRGLPRPADADSLRLGRVARLGRRGAARPRRVVALAAGTGGGAGGDRAVAAADAAHRTGARRQSSLRGLRARHPVQADREALCQCVAPHPRVVVLPADPAVQLAAVVPALSRLPAALVAAAEGARRARAAAAGLGGAGAAVLQRLAGQARRVHPARAADAGAGLRAVRGRVVAEA